MFVDTYYTNDLENVHFINWLQNNCWISVDVAEGTMVADLVDGHTFIFGPVEFSASIVPCKCKTNVHNHIPVYEFKATYADAIPLEYLKLGEQFWPLNSFQGVTLKDWTIPETKYAHPRAIVSDGEYHRHTTTQLTPTSFVIPASIYEND